MYVLQARGDAARFLLFHIFVAIMAASAIFIGVGHMMFGSNNQSYLIVVIFYFCTAFSRPFPRPLVWTITFGALVPPGMADNPTGQPLAQPLA